MASPSWTRESSLAIFLLIVTSRFGVSTAAEQLHALALNHLSDRQGRGYFASQITFAVGRLELSH